MGANCRLTHPLTIVAAACVLRWLLGNTNMGINFQNYLFFPPVSTCPLDFMAIVSPPSLSPLLHCE